MNLKKRLRRLKIVGIHWCSKGSQKIGWFRWGSNCFVADNNHCSPKSLQNPFQTTVAKFTISSTCNFKNLYKNNGKITKNIYKSLKSCKKLKKLKKKLKKKQTKNKKKKKKLIFFNTPFAINRQTILSCVRRCIAGNRFNWWLSWCILCCWCVAEWLGFCSRVTICSIISEKKKFFFREQTLA